MARDLGLPILPVSISGADGVMPTGSLKVLPGTINMTFHPPISTEQIAQMGDQELIKLTEDLVAAGIH